MAWFWNRKAKKTATRYGGDLQTRNYEAGSKSNRLSGWKTKPSDATAAQALSLPLMRDRSRDLVRNNPHAARIVQAITAHTIGTGIVGEIQGNDKLEQLWQAWAETTDCDADARHDLFGLQRLVMRCVVESGECLIRKVPSKSVRNDKGVVSIPLKLKVLEPDYLDDSKHGVLKTGGLIVRGIEYDANGTLVAYHLFNAHSGNAFGLKLKSNRIPASEIIHVFRVDRSGQARGVPWLATVMVKLRELDIFQDAQLKRQQISNLFAGFVYDEHPQEAGGEIEEEMPDLSPGTVFALKAGRRIDFNEPPTPNSGDFVRETLRDIATGVGITYEELTGDMSQVNFSSARMGRSSMFLNVEQWQWQMMIPTFCVGVEKAFLDAAFLISINTNNAKFDWTPPAKTLTDPTREIPAMSKAVRAGFKSYPEAMRELGFNYKNVLKQIAESNALLDRLSITLDTDPRVQLMKGVNNKIEELRAWKEIQRAIKDGRNPFSHDGTYESGIDVNEQIHKLPTSKN